MIMDCNFFHNGVITHYGQLTGYLEKWLSVSRSIHMNVFLQQNKWTYKKLMLTANSWLLYFCTGHGTWGLFYLNELEIPLLVLSVLSRNCKTRKVLLLPYIYRYTCSFILKLTSTTLYQISSIGKKNFIRLQAKIIPSKENSS